MVNEDYHIVSIDLCIRPLSDGVIVYSATEIRRPTNQSADKHSVVSTDNVRPSCEMTSTVDTIRYGTIGEFNVDSKDEY